MDKVIMSSIVVEIPVSNVDEAKSLVARLKNSGYDNCRVTKLNFVEKDDQVTMKKQRIVLPEPFDVGGIWGKIER